MFLKLLSPFLGTVSRVFFIFLDFIYYNQMFLWVYVSVCCCMKHSGKMVLYMFHVSMQKPLTIMMMMVRMICILIDLFIWFHRSQRAFTYFFVVLFHLLLSVFRFVSHLTWQKGLFSRGSVEEKTISYYFVFRM